MVAISMRERAENWKLSIKVSSYVLMKLRSFGLNPELLPRKFKKLVIVA